MLWTKAGRYFECSDSGHRVSAAKTAAGWWFSAWSPPQDPELRYWEWRARHITKWHYAIGEPIPHRSRLLGIFDTADKARDACRAHAERVNGCSGA